MRRMCEGERASERARKKVVATLGSRTTPAPYLAGAHHAPLLLHRLREHGCAGRGRETQLVQELEEALFDDGVAGLRTRQRGAHGLERVRHPHARATRGARAVIASPRDGWCRGGSRSRVLRGLLRPEAAPLQHRREVSEKTTAATPLPRNPQAVGLRVAKQKGAMRGSVRGWGLQGVRGSRRGRHSATSVSFVVSVVVVVAFVLALLPGTLGLVRRPMEGLKWSLFRLRGSPDARCLDGSPAGASFLRKEDRSQRRRGRGLPPLSPRCLSQDTTCGSQQSPGPPSRPFLFTFTAGRGARAWRSAPRALAKGSAAARTGTRAPCRARTARLSLLSMSFGRARFLDAFSSCTLAIATVPASRPTVQRRSRRPPDSASGSGAWLAPASVAFREPPTVQE